MKKHIQTKKNVLLVLIIIAVDLQSGCCFHRTYPPMLPGSWSACEGDEECLEDKPWQAKLQIIVMYHGTSCTHTALRLYSRTKGSLFWDPAGSFAIPKRYVGPDARRNIDFAAPPYMSRVRINDVIVEEAPSINQYMTWRKLINTHTVEVFEFNVSDSEAEELWTILRYGTKRSHPKGAFHTHTIGLTCGLAVARFLDTFAENIVDVDTVFFPHNLAKQLYRERPDRVIVYRESQLYFYVPPDKQIE